MISLTKDKELKGYKSLTVYPEVAHFVTTRHGGVSEGTYGSFNCSPYTKDSCINVNCNQNKLFQITGHQIKELVIPEQKHGCVCVTTADCVPVLLYDRRLQVVAAVHAGWKGTVQHIVSSVMEHMSRNFGTRGADVVACIGPSISLESFEVGDEVYEAFKESGFDMSIISTKKRKTGKHHIDLWEANRSELLYAGIPAGQIEVAGICTYIHQDDFFSARRLGIDSGRILSGIMIRK